MTHRATKHHPSSSTQDTDGTAGVVEEYVCTDAELRRAGFRVVEVCDMPEHESQFAPDPWGGDAPQIRPGAGLGERVEMFDPDPYPPEAA